MLLWEEPRTGEGIRYPLGSHQQRPNFQKSLFYKMFLGCENLTCVSSKKFSVHSKDTLAACAVKAEASLRCSWFRTNISNDNKSTNLKRNRQKTKKIVNQSPFLSCSSLRVICFWLDVKSFFIFILDGLQYWPAREDHSQIG